MSEDAIAVEAFRRELLQLLEETFEHVRGIYLDGGTSLFETLEGISAERASRPIAPGRATVAAHVEHAAFYLDVLDGVMRTHEIPKVDWREIWQRVHAVTPEEWEEEKRRLRESYRRVRHTVETYPSWAGEHGVSGSLAVLAHTAYHLGAIRQALGER